jgi:hypothetical protein
MLTLDQQRLNRSDTLVAFAVLTAFAMVSMSGVSHISGVSVSMLNSLHHALVHRSFACCLFRLRFAIVAPPSTSHRLLPMTQDASHCFHLLAHWTLGMPSAMHPQSTGYARHATHVADAISSFYPHIEDESLGKPLVRHCVFVTLVPSKCVLRRHHDMNLVSSFMVLSSPSLSPAAFVSIRVIVPVSTLPFYLTSPLALHVCVAALLFIPRSWCHGCYCPASWHFSVLQGWYSVAARFEGLIVSGLIILSQL